MADKVLGSASVEVFADLTNLRTGLNEARRQTTRAASDMSQAANGARRSFERAGEGLGRSIRTARTETEALNKELRASGTSLSGIFAGIGAGAAITGVIRLADEFTNLRARIALVATAGENADAIFERLFAGAQRNGASISALAALYVNLRQSIAGLSDAEAQQIAETISQTLALSGANAAESASFIRQISQALASGVLRGDEFNSVMESNAKFAKLLADQLGVSVGQLRGMAEQGKLTADVIRGAISGGAGGIAAEFESLPLTISRAYTELGNALVRYVGQTDQGLGASQRLAQGIELLAENFDSLADALIIVGGAGLANVLGRGISAGVEKAAEAGVGLSAEVTAKQAELIAQRQRALDRVARQDAALATAARQRVFIAEQIAAAEAQIAAERAKLDRRLQEGRAPLPPRPGETERQRRDRISSPAGDPNTFTRSQQIAVEQYRAEVDKLNRTIGNLRAAEDREAGAAAVAQNARRASAAAVEDLSTRLRVHTGVLATSGRIASAAGGLISRSFGSLINVLGGPIPALITAISVALLFYKSSADKAREANDSLASALGILSSASVPAANATAGAADASGDLAEKTGLAAEAADALAAAHGRAAGAARTRTDAEKALAEIQRIQAIATLQSAIADQRKAQAAAADRVRSNRARIASLAGLNGDGANTARGQFQGREALAQGDLDAASRSVNLLERGLKALTDGTLQLGSAQQATSAVTVEFGSKTETAAQKALRFAGATKTAADAQAELASRIFEVQQANDAGIAALDEKDAANREAKADRARQIIEDAQSELSKLRLQLVEIEDLTNGGFFAGNEESAGRATVDILVEMARAAGDAAEALAILRNTGGLDDGQIAAATKQIKDAARDGRDARNGGGIFRASDISQAAKSGLYDAVSNGQWKDAFRNAIYNALSRSLERSVDGLFDAIISAVGGGGGGGGILSSIGNAIGGLFGGGGGKGVTLPKRAAGGPVTAGTLYEVNEQGKELFLPNVNGSILSAGATKAATSSKGGNSSTIVQHIHNDMRGANIEDVGAAEARLEQAARRGAIMGAEMVQRQIKASTTI